MVDRIFPTSWAIPNPLAQHRVKGKVKHKDEKSKSLPLALRGKHFDAYFQICKALGCTQGTPSNQLVAISEK
jgi:Rieske Fe-S protein